MTKRNRAYVMLEAMIGAAVLGGALLVAYTNINDARVVSIQTMRQQMATELANRCIELARTKNFDSNFTGTNECQRTNGSPVTTPLTEAAFRSQMNAVRGGVNFVARLYVEPIAFETVTTSIPLPLNYRSLTAVVWYPNPKRTGQYISYSTTTRIYDRR
jgi:type II secretory pathway pseudopilin PulG